MLDSEHRVKKSFEMKSADFDSDVTNASVLFLLPDEVFEHGGELFHLNFLGFPPNFPVILAKFSLF